MGANQEARSILTRAETISRLRTHTLADQVAFRSEAGLGRLKFASCVEVEA